MSTIATSSVASSPASQPGGPTWEVAYLFPNQGHWSEEEYLALDTNRLVELVDGCLDVLPMPTIFHQLIVRFLYAALDAFVMAQALGTVLFAPLPVRMGNGRFREPDVLFLRAEHMRQVRGQPEGADLVMEVMSEGEENRRRDLALKRDDYAAARIPEYWIIDPLLQRITVLALDGDAYRVHGEFGPGERATSATLFGFSVAVSDVFAAGQAPA